MKSQLHILNLVYPPVSNQEAEWIKDEPEVRERLKESNLYMIGQREEGIFNINNDSILSDLRSKFKLPFSFHTKNSSCDGELDFDKLLSHHDSLDNNLNLEFDFGKKLIRIWECDSESNKKKKIVDWFTTEKLLFDKWRGHPGIKGFDNFRELTKYHLHYVGISKKEDSLTRLIVRPHDKRLRILSNEYPQDERSRITDEMILFFFKVEPVRFSIHKDSDDFKDFLSKPFFINEQIIADAEKAFVHVLDSKYNIVKFSQYPKGKDGLYGTGLARYGYVIGEDITFTTQTQEIVGGLVLGDRFSDDLDMIFIEGDEVSLVKQPSKNF